MSVQIRVSWRNDQEYLFEDRLFASTSLSGFPRRDPTKSRTVVFDLDNTLVESSFFDDTFEMALRPRMMTLVSQLISDETTEVILWTNGVMSYAVLAVGALEECFGVRFDYLIARPNKGRFSINKDTSLIKRRDAILVDDLFHSTQRQITVPFYQAAETTTKSRQVADFVASRLEMFDADRRTLQAFVVCNATVEPFGHHKDSQQHLHN